MRRYAIAVLAVIESVVACGIMAFSLQLAQELRANPIVGRLAHAVIVTTHHIATSVHVTIRYRA